MKEYPQFKAAAVQAAPVFFECGKQLQTKHVKLLTKLQQMVQK